MCVALPARIVSIGDVTPTSRPAKVHIEGRGLIEADLVMIPEARAGDYVIVHSGYAISRVDSERARETLALFDRVDSPVSAGTWASRSRR